MENDELQIMEFSMMCATVHYPGVLINVCGYIKKQLPRMSKAQRMRIKERDKMFMNSELKWLAEEIDKYNAENEEEDADGVQSMNIPEKCGECRHLGDYTSGLYARNPHHCCELRWRLYEEDYRVNPKTLDAKCPLKNEELARGIDAAR